MAPKRKTVSATKAGGKKIKEEPEALVKDKFTSAKEALKATGPQVKANRKPDSICHLSDAEVRTNHFMLTHFMSLEISSAGISNTCLSAT